MKWMGFMLHRDVENIIDNLFLDNSKKTVWVKWRWMKMIRKMKRNAIARSKIDSKDNRPKFNVRVFFFLDELSSPLLRSIISSATANWSRCPVSHFLWQWVCTSHNMQLSNQATTIWPSTTSYHVTKAYVGQSNATGYLASCVMNWVIRLWMMKETTL